jgi:ketosteroid isomerase-like protein
VSQENATLAWRASYAWSGGGTAALLPFLDPEVAWHPPHEVGAYCGQVGVSEYLGRLGAAFEGAHVEPVRIVEIDEERVISLMRATDDGRGDISAELAWLIEVRRGKFVEVRTFTDHAQAVRAARLSP